MRHWLLLALAIGCGTKANSKYCDTTCPDPGMICDQVAHVCVAGMPDLAVPDMAMPTDMSIAIDLNGIDLLNADFTPVPACTMSTACPNGVPICDATSKMCRPCNSAGDDGDCATHSAATPHCKLSGTNAGLCAACNVSADCPTATPVCNPDGTCRTCAANSECTSLICDTTSGACVAQSDIIYVNSTNDSGQGTCTDGTPGGKDGTIAHPYCQITTAVSALSLVPRHYILVEPSDNTYGNFEVSTTTGTLIILGPGRNAAKKATVQAATDLNAIHIDPPIGSTASVGIVGLTVIGNGNGSVLACGDNGGTVNLSVIDSSFTTSNKNGLFLSACNASISQSTMSNASQAGISIAAGATYSIQNCAMFGNGIGVLFGSASGSFSFNTVINNKGMMPGGIDCSAAAAIADSIVFNNKTMGGTQFNHTACVLSNVVTGTDSYTGATQLSPVFTAASDPHLDLTPGANLTANQACCIDKINGVGPAPSPSPLPSVDIDNSMRPKGAHWDIGAHEAM